MTTDLKQLADSVLREAEGVKPDPRNRLDRPALLARGYLDLLAERDQLRECPRVSEEQNDALGDANMLGVEVDRLKSRMEWLEEHMKHYERYSANLRAALREACSIAERIMDDGAIPTVDGLRLAELCKLAGEP